MIRADLIDPIERLEQFIYELQVLQEIEEKIIGAEVSDLSPVLEIEKSVINAIHLTSCEIRTLSGEILEELKG